MTEETSTVHVGERQLEGLLTIPGGAKGLAIFAHGSGSSRFSPRNTHVARALNRSGLATLLFDLLTEAEAADRNNVFDIALLGGRVAEAVHWAREDDATKALPVGLFGSSTGAAAALIAAAEQPQAVSAVVSRGGRPDLAEPVLDQVTTPTLLIVGGWDGVVITLNERAHDLLAGDKQLLIVAGATHLFEEPRTLDQVVEAAADWFTRHFRKDLS
ncbi:MAG: dienelactone hydrolase family protein [Alphaproteobacteria bacterium]